MGDIKMAAVLGAAGGLIHPVVGLITVFIAALSSGLFALKLAAKLAWTLQQSRTLRESMLLEYDRKLPKALAQAAREGKRPIVNELFQSNWLRNRLNSTNG